MRERSLGIYDDIFEFQKHHRFEVREYKIAVLDMGTRANRA